MGVCVWYLLLLYSNTDTVQETRAKAYVKEVMSKIQNGIDSIGK